MGVDGAYCSTYIREDMTFFTLLAVLVHRVLANAFAVGVFLPTPLLSAVVSSAQLC